MPAWWSQESVMIVLENFYQIENLRFKLMEVVYDESSEN